MPGGIYTSTLSSMDRSKLEFSIAAQNIANANEADYSRVKVNVSPAVVNGMPQGVQIDSLSSFIDENLQNSLYNKISVDSYYQTISKYMAQANHLFGDPASSIGIDAKLGEAFTALENLSRNPSSATLGLLAMRSIESLADSITQTARSVHQLRMDIDSELGASLSELNHLLEQTHNAMGTVAAIKDGSLEKLNAEAILRGNYEKISNFFDIYIYSEAENNPKIFTTEGDALINDIITFFKYEPLSSLNDYIYDSEFNPVLASAKNKVGDDMTLKRYLVGGGTSDAIPSKYTTGKIGGLLRMRDRELPTIIAQLDNFANNIKNEFNKIHNNYSGFPPAQILTGTTAVTCDQVLAFTGSVRIAVVDAQGQPIPNLEDFKLNLSQLDNGLANTQSIINEINYHFGQKAAATQSISLGNLSDLRLVSRTADISSGITFALEMDNFSQTDSVVQILSATATDGSAANILASFANSTTTIAHGTIGASDPASTGVVLNLASPPNYPIDITLQVSVNDGTTTTVSNLVYTITNFANDPINGNKNQRIPVSSKVNPADPGTISPAAFSSPIISASLIDNNGSVIAPGSTTAGFLKIQAGASNYHIIIDSLDSTQSGSIASNVVGSGDNFSYFFGLNDLFVRKDNASLWQGGVGLASNLSIRDDIALNPSLLSLAKLAQVQDYVGPNHEIYQYQIGIGDNTGAVDMLSLLKKGVIFKSAGSLAATQVTLAEYIANIVAFNAAQTSKSISQADQSELLRSAIADQLRNLKGVDINQELTNMIIFQQSFAAAAKALKTGNELYDILFEAI